MEEVLVLTGFVNRVCTYCNRNNHTIDTCFLKHGYPPGYKHKKQVHNVVVAGSDATASSPLMSLTNDQIQGLLALLPVTAPTASSSSSNLASAHHFAAAPTAGGKCSIDWIVDSGATDHISSSLHFFSSYRAIKPMVVSLPNG